MRWPSAGSELFGAADRIVILAVPLFARSLIGPSNTPLGSTMIVSPGCAASIAAWRLPPTGTVIVAAPAPRANSRDIARDSPTAPNFFKRILQYEKRGRRIIEQGVRHASNSVKWGDFCDQLGKDARFCRRRRHIR